MKRIKQVFIGCITVAIIGMVTYVFWLNKDNEVTTATEERVALSPTQVRSIEAIGQWEFLAIADEELVDTIRKGFFSDDQLTRIYYGTLRLGIDMRQVSKDWIVAQGDSVSCTLPPIVLLDQNFIDEARTRAFFENGKWSVTDREALYRKACSQMKRRCMTPTNMAQARENGRSQFSHLLQTMGFKNVKVTFVDE